MSPILADIPSAVFLESYPYPAFILDSNRRTDNPELSLKPIWENASFARLVFGSDSSIDRSAFGQAFEDFTTLQKFGSWVDSSDRESTFTVGWRSHSWSVTGGLADMVLVKTIVKSFIIITSTPVSHFPEHGQQGNQKHGTLTRTSPETTGLHSPISVAELNSFDSPRASFPRKPLLPPPKGEMARLIETYDWVSAGLPAYPDWPQSLKSSVSFVLAAPYNAAVWWGKDLTLIYNDSYAAMSGTKHPAILGLKGAVSWRELNWDVFEPLVKQVFSGQCAAKMDDLLFFNQLGPQMLPRESYHCWSWTPVLKEDGSVGGMINFTFESTRNVISQRRMDVLRVIGERSASCKDEAEFTRTLISILKQNCIDLPFTAIYRCREALPERPPSPFSGETEPPVIAKLRPFRVNLTLAAFFGVPSGTASFPEKTTSRLDPFSLKMSPRLAGFHLPKSLSPSSMNDSSENHRETSSSAPSGMSEEGTIRPDDTAYFDLSARVSENDNGIQTPSTFLWPFVECITDKRVVHVKDLPPTVAPGVEGVSWGDTVREALLIPISEEGENIPSAVVIVGVNTRLVYDEEYSTWIEVLRSTMANGWDAAGTRAAEIQRAEELQSLDAAKTAFFSNASHELRTPLTLIAGPLEDSIQQVTNEKVKHSLTMALRNVARLARMVDSLLDFSRLEAGKMGGSFKPVRLGAFTMELANLFRSTIERNSIEYTVNCDTESSHICYVDPEFWEKICFNLIGNAFKYTLQGSIKVTLTYDEKTARLTVADTGVGIPKADLSQIGVRFHRVESVSRSHEGTGIGLSLTKELIKLHGGTMELSSQTAEESEDNKHGSTFSVIIPLGRDHLPRKATQETLSGDMNCTKYGRSIVDEASRWGQAFSDDFNKTPSDSSESGGSSNESTRLSGSSLFMVKTDVIMIVEDNDEMRHYIKSLFTPYCRVIDAVNGKDALEKCRLSTPDLIISDQMMPVMDGHGLFQALHAEESELRLIPFILLTADAGDDARVNGLLKGFDDYLTKPFKARELIARANIQLLIGKQRRQLDALYHEQVREVKRLSDLSPVGIYRADAEGRITYVNDRWKEIIEHHESSGLDDWFSNVNPDDLRKVETLWRAAVDDHEKGTLEFRWKNGGWAQAQIEPLYHSGAFVGILGTFTDVSDRRRYEAAQLAHAREREADATKRMAEADERRILADEQRRSQELLIDVTSHELRQPVSAILNCSALVRSNASTLRQQLVDSLADSSPFHPSQELIDLMDEDLEALDAIYQCGLAQERIANDVLSLSRIQLEVLTIHPVDFDLAEEVKGIIAIFRNEVKMKRIGLSLNIGNSVSELGIQNVKTDKARFAQVITNLLSNAIKFTDTSQRDRQITVTLDVSSSAPSDGPCVPPLAHSTNVYDGPSPKPVYLFIAVKDSGPGLKPDDLALLFQRFAQGSNSHEVFGGSGLGLFVSRQLCGLMNGRIDVDSVFGKGATFRFFIQAMSCRPSAPRMSREASSNRVALMPKVSGPASRPLHILITEDNLINQTVLNRQLKKEGCTTALASNGLEAIEHIKNLNETSPSASGQPGQFDAVLMDCEMPVMDGLTAVREIRRMEAARELPRRSRIYALTGNARDGQVENARDAGMDDVLIKPYKLDSLMNLLRGET